MFFLKAVSICFIAVYIIVRMVGDFFFLRSISEYYSYLFEVGFVVFAGWIYRDQITFFKVPSKTDVVGMVVAFLFSFMIYKIADWFQIQIPFDLQSQETVFLLLLLAPVLEEAIFRMALWQAFVSFISNSWLVIFLTTIFFGLGHFNAYWFVPEEYKSFVIYQTSYVMLLGFGVGWVRYRSQAIISPIFVHFCFNLGFYLGAR